MKTVRLSLVLLIVLLVISACDRSKPLPEISEMKTSFSKIVFTQPHSGRTITLVSETECEIAGRQGILLADYSRESNKLRVVMRVGGTDSVTYYDIDSGGLQNRDSGEVFLLPGQHGDTVPKNEALRAFQSAKKEAKISSREVETVCTLLVLQSDQAIWERVIRHPQAGPVVFLPAFRRLRDDKEVKNALSFSQYGHLMALPEEEDALKDRILREAVLYLPMDGVLKDVSTDHSPDR